MDLNKAMLIGNLTRDPETRTTPSGQTVCSFGLATNRVWTDASGQQQRQAEFHNIVTWGKLAEICGQYLTKGRKVFIEGRIQTREWQGQDGVRKQRTEIVADNMILLDRPGAKASTETEASVQASEATADSPNNNESGDEGIKVESIPF